jgi:hypothetical protein
VEYSSANTLPLDYACGIILEYRLFVALGSLLFGLLWSILGAESAAAIVVSCRADPIVWLSNGTKVTMTASIAADASQVNLITYTVHAPRGLAAAKVVYTGGALQNKERVVTLFDRASGYQIEMVVNLRSTAASTTLSATVGNTSASIAGSSAKSLVLVFP